MLYPALVLLFRFLAGDAIVDLFADFLKAFYRFVLCGTVEDQNAVGSSEYDQYFHIVIME